MRDWLSTDWLLLRPLLVVAITWTTLLVALLSAWIRKRMAARRHRSFADSTFRQLVPAGRQVARPEIDSGSLPPCSSATDRESRAA